MPQEGVGGGWRGLEGQEGRVGGACQLAGGGRRAGAPSNASWTWGVGRGGSRQVRSRAVSRSESRQASWRRSGLGRR